MCYICVCPRQSSGYLRMSHSTRREFLLAWKKKQSDQLTGASIAPLPDNLRHRATNPPDSGLELYTGTWGTAEIMHLLRRCTFGPQVTDIDHFSPMSVTEAVDTLLYQAYTAPPLPVNDYNDNDATDPDVPAGSTWINAYYSNLVEGRRVESLRSWWVRLIMAEQHSIREKMTLFWHNHIPVEFYGVFYGAFLYRYLDKLRTQSLGNFKELVKSITLDAAMLGYLNGNENGKAAPDENFAREIQELFVIGKDRNPHYTESDVRAAARLLTGWRIDWNTFGYYFDEGQHDTDDKQFSTFYGSRTIKGETGPNGGMKELDAFLDMLFDHQETALFLCRKLYRFFVFHEIDATVETNVIQPLAAIFRANNYEILPVLDVLLKSEHFFDAYNRGAVIKSPLDVCVGMYRQFNIQLPDENNPRDRYLIPLYTAFSMSNMLQLPGDPPNVAGWQAYYQKPALDKTWINTSSLPKRVEFGEAMLNWGYYGDTERSVIDSLQWARSLRQPGDVNELIAETLSLLIAIPVEEELIAFLKKILLSDLPSEYYWTVAWDAYLLEPDDPMKRGVVETRLKSFLWWVLQLEEYQLM